MNPGVIFFCLALTAPAAELPRLDDYPIKLSPTNQPVKAIVPDVSSGSRCIRNLRYDKPEVPNFSDHFTLFFTGCGTGCAEFCVIDRVSGQVFPGFTFAGGPEIFFSRNSRLVLVKHTDGMYADDDAFYADCYVWEGDRFRFLGRWTTSYGASKKEIIDWAPEIMQEANPPNWR